MTRRYEVDSWDEDWQEVESSEAQRAQADLASYE